MNDIAPVLRGCVPALRVWGRATRIFLAVLLFVGDTGVWAAQDIWTQRRKAARSLRNNAGPSLSDRLAASFPSIAPEFLPTEPSQLPAWVANTVGLYADVRAYVPPKPGQRRVLIHVQDLHEVEEAQRNIASLLDQLAGSAVGTDGLWVGLEGAAGPFRTEDFRALAPPSVIRRVSDRFLRAGLISGPEYFGLTTERPFRLWGTEDPAAYEANIRALTQTFATQPQDDVRLAQARSRMDRLKKTLYPPALLALDEAQTAYESGQLPLTGYVKKISENVLDREMGPSLVRYREALRQEADLSLENVEADQQRLLEHLAPRLTDLERRRLSDSGLACRLGRARHGTFLAALKEICRQHRVDLSGYPHFLAHSAYIEKVEGLKAEELLEDVDRLAKRRMELLAADPAVAQAMELDRDLKLVEKLNRFSLVPAEFVLWNQRRPAVARWDQRGTDLIRVQRLGRAAESARFENGHPIGAEVEDRWPAIIDVADRHGAFYRWAETRNRPLVNNLLARWTDDRPAVLVAGGFHADGLRAVAQSEGVGYIGLVPRVLNTKQFPPPLESFRSKDKPLKWRLPGPSALQNRLQTAGSEIGGSDRGRVHFVTAFVAMVYAALVMDPESRSPLSTQAVEKLRGEALSRFGVDLVPEDPPQENGNLKLMVRFLSAPDVPAYTVTISGGRLAGEAREDLWVGMQPISSWRQAAAFIRRADDSISSIGPAIRLWVTRVLPQAIDQMGLAFRRTAVYLIPTVRSAGGSGLLNYLGGLKNRWAQTILLAREREYVANALSQPPAVRNGLLAALAENHTVKMPDVWIQSLTESINGQKVGAPVVSNDKKNLVISLGREESSVSVRLHVTRAIALYERPADYSPYQLVKRPDGTIDVYLAEPVVSSPDRLLPLVIRRLLREINGQTSGDFRLEDRQILLGMWEALVQYSVNSWASYISGQELKPRVGIPRQGDRSAWKPGTALNFLGGEEPYYYMDDTGLFVLTGAPPKTKASVELTVDVEGLIERLTSLGWNQDRARIQAETLMAERLDRSILLLQQFQEFADQRRLLTRLSWWVDRPVLANSGANLVIDLLKHVGASQGQMTALNNIPYDQALQAQMTEQFPFLARTLLGLMKMAGQPLDRANVEEQRARLADMWTVYAEHFALGHGQLSSVVSSPSTEAAVAQVDGVAAGVFHLAAETDTGSLNQVLDVLLSRDLSRFKVSFLVSGKSDELKETVVPSLKKLINERDLSQEQRGTVSAFLDGQDVMVVAVADAQIQLDRVFQQIAAQWEAVTHVDVYTANAAAFDTNVATLLSWALFENGVLISKSVESALAEQRIRVFIQQQA